MPLTTLILSPNACRTVFLLRCEALKLHMHMLLFVKVLIFVLMFFGDDVSDVVYLLNQTHLTGSSSFIKCII